MLEVRKTTMQRHENLKGALTCTECYTTIYEKFQAYRQCPGCKATPRSGVLGIYATKYGWMVTHTFRKAASNTWEADTNSVIARIGMTKSLTKAKKLKTDGLRFFKLHGYVPSKKGDKQWYANGRVVYINTRPTVAGIGYVGCDAKLVKTKSALYTTWTRLITKVVDQGRVDSLEPEWKSFAKFLEWAKQQPLFKEACEGKAHLNRDKLQPFAKGVVKRYSKDTCCFILGNKSHRISTLSAPYESNKTGVKNVSFVKYGTGLITTITENKILYNYGYFKLDQMEEATAIRDTAMRYRAKYGELVQLVQLMAWVADGEP